MKKILFVINSLTIGGSEKSLVSLLNSLDYSKYEVDLMMFKHGDDFDIYIPKEVNILKSPSYYRYINKESVNISNYCKVKYNYYRVKTSLRLRINSIKKNSINTEQILYMSQNNILENIEKKYDIAIAYSQGMPTYFVAEKVDANKKIAWINCDYATTRYDKDKDENFYNKFDKIVAVSKTIEKSILKIKPQYKNKIEVILDIVNPKLIESMAEEDSVLNDKSNINILTVARLVIHHKGYDTALKAAKLLKENNYKFKWFVVGEGEDRGELEKLINKYKLNDYFILLGKKENPYPYMKNCDIYVQPSKREGFGLTVMEAKILKKPIVCTNFNTAKELINSGFDGLIVEHDEKSLYLGIKKYIDNNDFKESILKKLNKDKQYSSIDEVNKFYNLIEDRV